MSTMVQMPVRVKPPPAETGDTISPGCASFEIATPLNGARMTVLSRSVCCTRDLALGDARPARAARRSAPRCESTSACACVDLGLRSTTPSLTSCVPPAERQLRLGEPHLVLAHGRARGDSACASASASAARGVRVVEPGEHLALA